MRVVGVDADLIVYTVAFVAEAKEKEGEYLNEFQVNKITNTVYNTILLHSKATHHLGFLTDSKSNFRRQRAWTWRYKGQRKKQEVPHFYDHIRAYLQSHWGCQMMYGVEADDALVIAGEHFKTKGTEYVLASKDKDLRQYPCLHLDMNINKLITIDEEKGHRNLWKQMILGDVATDNIPGLSHAAKFLTVNEGDPKVRPLLDHLYGEKKAEEILDTVDPKDYASHILSLYVDAYEDFDLGYARYLETFDLVWMLRECPQDVKIHYNPIKAKRASLEFEDVGSSSEPLEF